MSRPINDNLRSNARRLRQTMTDVEKHVWYHLRGRRFQGYKFRRQFPIGRYIVDFVCLEKTLVIECDGGQHNESTEIEYDEKRTAYLERCGYKVMRFWNHIILQDWEVVEEVIYRELLERKSTGDCTRSPSPLTPLPLGERGTRQDTRTNGTS